MPSRPRSDWWLPLAPAALAAAHVAGLLFFLNPELEFSAWRLLRATGYYALLLAPPSLAIHFALARWRGGAIARIVPWSLTLVAAVAAIGDGVHASIYAFLLPERINAQLIKSGLWLALAAILPITWSPLVVYFGITVILGLLDWTGLARTVRSKLLALREEDYVSAAQVMGASSFRIVSRHLIPGFASHLIATATIAIPSMILGETTLSFLGLGLRAPITSWGVLLTEAQNINAVALYPWLLWPVLPVILVVLAFNFLGDGLRDAADPYK